MRAAIGGGHCAGSNSNSSFRLLVLMLALLLLDALATVILPVAAASDADSKISISESEFNEIPESFFFFEDGKSGLYLDSSDYSLWRSTDAGATWSAVKDISSDAIDRLIKHSSDGNQAIIIGPDKTHFLTTDSGRSWQKFSSQLPAATSDNPIVFSQTNPKAAIFFGDNCERRWGWFDVVCKKNAYYTTDGFATLKSLRDDVKICTFAENSKESKIDPNLVLCLEENHDFGNYPDNLELVTSKDWFETVQKPLKQNGVTVHGINSIILHEDFIIAAAQSERAKELQLFVSQDAVSFSKASFPQGLELRKGFSSFFGSKHDVQVDILQSFGIFHPVGTLLSSDSSVTAFTVSLEHTNRDLSGDVDYVRSSSTEGVAFANVVSNWQEIKKGGILKSKVLKTQISFDGGHLWHPIQANDTESSKSNGIFARKKDKPKEPDRENDSKTGDDSDDDDDSDDNSDDGDENDNDNDNDDEVNVPTDRGSKNSWSLHFHLRTEKKNLANLRNNIVPGIFLNVGSQGAHLADYSSSDLYISSDSGRSWLLTRKGPHQFAVADNGGIILAIPDKSTDSAYFSTDYGHEWKAVKLPKKIKPIYLTSPNAKGKKFMLFGDTKGKENIIGISLDFSSIFNKKCAPVKNSKSNDLEEIQLGIDGCVLGRKRTFWRRKLNRKCFISDNKIYNEDDLEVCNCNDADYECDVNFHLNSSGECKTKIELKDPLDQCKKKGDKYMASSGYRKIAGDMCKAESGKEKDKKIERVCETTQESKMVNIANVKSLAAPLTEILFSERSAALNGMEDTVIVKSRVGEILRSPDMGQTWKSIFTKKSISHVFQHPHLTNWFYFLPHSGKKAFISSDRGEELVEMTLPVDVATYDVKELKMNYADPMLLILILGACEDKMDSVCEGKAYYSKNGGNQWKLLRNRIETCDFIRNAQIKAKKNLILCTALEKDKKFRNLIASANFFKSEQVVYEKSLGFALFDEFLIVAKVSDGGEDLEMAVSVNGYRFSMVRYPPNLKPENHKSYTILDSSTKSLFIHMTQTSQESLNSGMLLKSNSNGTYFVTSINEVNRDDEGIVDFERIQGSEGTIIINIVSNANKAKDEKSKALQSMISFSDGARWLKLRTNTGAQLNLFGATELARRDISISSPANSGFLMAVGNEGDELLEYKQGSTYQSDNGGLTWKLLRKTPYLSAIGDQGSLFVIVKDNEPTNVLEYSTDQGASWKEYKFSEDKFTISAIRSTPSGISRRFILYAVSSDNKEFAVIAVSLEGTSKRICSENGDFETFQPSSPDLENGCLFGHKIQYQRKASRADCFLGDRQLELKHITKNCTCTKADYECDFNYERASDGTCQLVKSLKPIDPSLVCKEKDVFEYFEPTGYRKVPLTTCQGGLNLDKKDPKPCKGKENEFYEHRRKLSGWSVFLVVVVPIILSAVIATVLFQKMREIGMGQIQLGGEEPSHPIPRLAQRVLDSMIPVFAFMGAAGTSLYIYFSDKISAFLARRRRSGSSRFGYTRLGGSSAPMTLDDAEIIDDILGDEEGDDEFNSGNSPTQDQQQRQYL